MDLKALKKQESKRKISKGYMWALFCAVFWGIWYLPGTVVWVLNPFDEMYLSIAKVSGDGVSLVVTAVLITAFNALTVMLALILWNGVLGKYGELGRTLKEFHPCSKWFFLASIFGGPIAILGSFIAMGFIGGAFAAVAALLYPVVGSILAYYWYGEKISKRAALGIGVIIVGGITIFGGGLLTELSSGTVPWIGYLGGLMAAAGWGIEGAIAGKGLDISEPDAGLTLRFLGENIIWWIIIIPLLALFGFPMYSFALQVFESPDHACSDLCRNYLWFLLRMLVQVLPTYRCWKRPGYWKPLWDVCYYLHFPLLRRCPSVDYPCRRHSLCYWQFRHVYGRIKCT